MDLPRAVFKAQNTQLMAVAGLQVNVVVHGDDDRDDSEVVTATI